MLPLNYTCLWTCVSKILWPGIYTNGSCDVARDCDYWHGPHFHMQRVSREPTVGSSKPEAGHLLSGRGGKEEDLWTLGGGASAGGGTSPALVGVGRVRFDIKTNPCVQGVPKFKPSPRRVKHKLRSNRTPSCPCLHCSYWGGVGSECSSLGWGNEEINEGPKIRLPVKWLLGVWGAYLLAWHLLCYSLTAKI